MVAQLLFFRVSTNELAHEEYTGKTERYAPQAHTCSIGAGFPEWDHEPAERESNPIAPQCMRECCGLPAPPEGITIRQRRRVILQGK